MNAGHFSLPAWPGFFWKPFEIYKKKTFYSIVFCEHFSNADIAALDQSILRIMISECYEQQSLKSMPGLGTKDHGANN